LTTEQDLITDSLDIKPNLVWVFVRTN